METDTRSNSNKYNHQKNRNGSNLNQFPLMQLQGSRAYVAGEICAGKFTSLLESDPCAPEAGQFQNRSNWNQNKRKRVKRFRFVVCNLSLVALALSVMSRSLFNLAIVEMTRDVHVETTDFISENATESSNNYQPQIPQADKTDQPHEGAGLNSTSHHIVSVFTVNDSDDENPETGLHFDWSVGATNFLLSAFFIGYAPSMFFSGGIAEQYGSVTLLSVSVVGSALINVFTPLMAAYSYHALAVSRVVLGFLQGPLVPACYDMFNKWLTITEMSFFVPLVRVSMAIGMLAGSSLPGFVVLSGHDWTYNFYIGSFVCLVWAFFWFPAASSTPQTNKWIEESELQRIMRKKSTHLAVIKLAKPNDPANNKTLAADPAKESIPWMQIMTSPSVLALTLVKFTFNLGIDFLGIMSPLYLSEIHGAPTETVSIFAGAGCIMQMVLISFVGGLATYLVRKRTLGLSRTNWRKIFQGTANFTMALFFGLIPYLGRFDLVVSLFMLVYFFSMFAAGGESMVPYDLSFKYPATIMGFAHSLSILSGFVLPSVCSLILGGDKGNPALWNVLFLLISASLAIGGLAFVFVVKSKPFLPNERAKYDALLAKEKSKRLSSPD